MPPQSKKNKPNLMLVIRPYMGWIILLIATTIAGNALSLLIPKIIAQGIDAFSKANFDPQFLITEFSAITIGVFILAYLQSIIQTYVSEIAAKDLREKLISKISKQSFSYIQKTSPEKLLTNLTSDIDAIKQFIAMAIATMIASVFLIIGASTLLIVTNWKLGLAVLALIPLIAATFFVILGKVRTLFKETQEVIDRLNKVINESILGAALIRILHAENTETTKFTDVNSKAKEIGLKILGYFSAMIPIITFVASSATIIILALGGLYVLSGEMTLGDIAAFNSYLAMLIFPIIMIGFMSNIMARASASYERIAEVLEHQEKVETGTHDSLLQGEILLENVTLKAGEKFVVKNVSFDIKPHTKTAIIGPTGAGKTQLLYLLTGLISPDEGTIKYDGLVLDEYDKTSFYKQIGFVFQDSILFNLSVRENIAFSDTANDEKLEKAIATAELKDFIDNLPQKLETIISERGTSLSGGQKQRIMLARALTLDPKILLLDDFTSRVDTSTEQKIVQNIKTNYSNVTLVSVTQKIASIEDYDQIILLMEGEVIAKGTHKELMNTSPEYVQIYSSQRSTNNYELRTE